jgi:hypothetical protein
MRATFAVSLLLVGALAGCFLPVPEPTPDKLPPLDWEGERVVFGTFLLDEVCVGTLAALDASVESIEQELSLPPSDEKIPFYLLDDTTFVEYCDSQFVACVSSVHDPRYPTTVYSSVAGMDFKRHELVHARLIGLEGVGGGRFWKEGIAAALDRDGGCLASDACSTADLDSLLQGHFGDLWFKGYTAGADMVHGLLVEHGPEAVLAFMAELSGRESPDEVRAIYLNHFGSVLDDDFQAYMRGPFDDYTVAQRGCDALIPAPTGGDAGGVAIQATMDCSSPDVVNVYHDPDLGVIEWTFVVTPEQSGAFTISRSPESEFVALQTCPVPISEGPSWREYYLQMGNYSTDWRPSSDTTTLLLAPGQYKLRWPAEFGSSIDLTLTPPCTFELGDCAAGQQCNIWNECRPEALSPAALGEPCEQEPDGPLACTAGSRCSGGVCVAECDAAASCSMGQACSRFRVCGTTCSLVAQDCEAGFTCLPSADESMTSLGSGVCIGAGEKPLLEPCDWRQSECAEGLSCEPWGNVCVPLCDPNAPAPACPEEAPICNPLREGPAGFCRVKKSSE